MSEVSEKEVLMSRADKLGIKYSNNISIEKLKEKIDEVLGDKQEAQNLIVDRSLIRAKLIADKTKLVRIRLTCMNPAKKEWPGEIFSVANEYIGSHKKYVPYGQDGTDEGYHVMQCILDVIQERKFLRLKDVKNNKGATIVKKELIKEFAVEILPQLTEKELKELADRQKAHNSIGDE